MFLRTKVLRIAGSLLGQGVLILANLTAALAPSLSTPAPSFAAIRSPAAPSPATPPSKSRSSSIAPAALAPPAPPLVEIEQYISQAWGQLTRSMIQCQSLTDTKTTEPPLLYLPVEQAGNATPAAVTELQKRCAVRVETLPGRITTPGGMDPARIRANGLLYLEHPYVVPGGQFNEMYGWDSYFIIRGLLAPAGGDQDPGRRGSPDFSGADPAHLTLAKGMVENFFFEIEHYGGVLNANRTYYLTRSQPPFLSSMILAVYDAALHDTGARNTAQESAAQESAAYDANKPLPVGSPDAPSRTKTFAPGSNLEWLARAYGYAVRDYEQWTSPPHLAGNTGLARYFDRGDGPVPEIADDPSHYYSGVAQYFLLHGGAGTRFLSYVDPSRPAPAPVAPIFSLNVCDPAAAVPAGPATAPPAQQDASQTASQTRPCAPAAEVALTTEYYKGDRSMRESGFDVTFRFGPFGADTHHFAPVCLNSLLYKTEKDLETISTILGRPADARRWREKARERRQRIFKYLWDARRGMFFDYDFTTGTRSSYEYATTFYPLWAGVASPQQARAVARNLVVFEQPGGLAMSRRETQAQWDYPYGWAPIHLLAAEGLRRYGYAADASRISQKFLETVLHNFEADRTIREKYDVVARSRITHVGAGYAQNVIGFGWTNGVFLSLLQELPPASRAQLN